jgi:hypothetical protein
MLLKAQTVSYEDLGANARTGDVILMHGTYTSSRIIQFFEGCEWSHSAMIVIAGDLGLDLPKDQVLLWESNVHTPARDVILNETKTGPMLVDLKERIYNNFEHKDDSAFAIRHLYTERDAEMFENLRAAIDETHDAVFPSSKDEFGHFLEGRLHERQAPPGSFFCSQLLAHTFMKLGLVSTLHPDNAYAPADFSQGLSLPLLRGAFLGPEIQLDTNALRETVGIQPQENR